MTLLFLKVICIITNIQSVWMGIFYISPLEISSFIQPAFICLSKCVPSVSSQELWEGVQGVDGRCLLPWDGNSKREKTQIYVENQDTLDLEGVLPHERTC